MSDVPDERAEARWYEVRALVHAIANDDINLGDATDALMALADAEVAAERQRLHDLEVRIEALLAELERLSRPCRSPYPDSLPDPYERGHVHGLDDAWRMLHAALVSEASASSPVSDDTGGTK